LYTSDRESEKKNLSNVAEKKRQTNTQSARGKGNAKMKG
jgi:hypothetical protein